MNKSQRIKFQSLYRKHVSALKRQGKAESTIDVYARAVRRVAQFWDCCPDHLTQEQLEAHFDALVASHSWSTVKVDRNGLQFFYEHRKICTGNTRFTARASSWEEAATERCNHKAPDSMASVVPPMTVSNSSIRVSGLSPPNRRGSSVSLRQFRQNSRAPRPSTHASP